MAQVNETKSTADTLTVYKKLSVENDISATGAITQNGNQVISGITTASGANIGSVGTPSVTASTSNGTTTLTFDYLKGAKGDKGDTGATGATGPQGPTGATGATGSVASVSTTGSGNAVTSVTMDANKNVTATKGATFLTSHQTLPTALKNPNAIKFKNASGTEDSYDGSAAKDLTGGVYYAAGASGLKCVNDSRPSDLNALTWTTENGHGYAQFATGIKGGITNNPSTKDGSLLHLGWDTATAWASEIFASQASNELYVRYSLSAEANNWSDWDRLATDADLSGYLPLASNGVTLSTSTEYGLTIKTSPASIGWTEGLYIYDSSDGWSTLTLGDSSKSDLLAIVHNADNNRYYLETKVDGGTPFVVNIPTSNGINSSSSMIIDSKVLADGYDLNNCYTSGFYRFQTPGSNNPGVYHGQMIVCSGIDTTAQLLFPYNSTAMYVRTGINPNNSNGATWQDWKTVAFNDSIPTNISQLTNDSGYTTNAGTVTSVAVKMNGSTKGTVTSSGTIDLGTVLTADYISKITSSACYYYGSFSSNSAQTFSPVMWSGGTYGAIYQITGRASSTAATMGVVTTTSTTLALSNSSTYVLGGIQPNISGAYASMTFFVPANSTYYVIMGGAWAYLRYVRYAIGITTR